jgi:FAD/FMN-containing dehydrogenase
MAATIAAGMQDREVYALSHEHGVVVVGGSNPSVGIMGWFPGGGHGPLSSSYGMGADNLLEAQVVTPQGELVTTNACQHSDLFWALRGGGSGTFGIIVDATMKAYPTPQTTIASLIIYQAQSEVANLSSRWWKLTADMHAHFPQIKDGGGQGYYTILAPPAVPAFTMSFFTYHYDSTNETVESLWQPVKDLLDLQQDMASYTYATYTTPTFFDMWNASTGQAFEAVATGGGRMASRLLTRRALTENVDAVARTFGTVGPIIAGHLIANDKNRDLDIALNPGWRDTVTHIIVVSEYNDDDPPEIQERVKDETQSIKAYALKQLSPESGAYFNEVSGGRGEFTCKTNWDRLIHTSQIGSIHSSVRTTHD